VVLDWVRFSRGHRGWFQPDGVHLTFPGAHAFARLFKQALPFAQPQPPAP
jgi:lysophospholipase L1-like esterase